MKTNHHPIVNHPPLDTETLLGDFLSCFFTTLNKENIDYCVLRNYEHLPNHVDHDVDIILDSHHEMLCRNILTDIAKQKKWLIIYQTRRFEYFSYYLIKETEIGFQFVHIDFHTQIHYRTFIYSDRSVIINSRKYFNGFQVASSGSEAAVSLFKEYLRSGKVKEKGDGKTKQRIRKLTQEDPENFLSSIVPFFGSRISKFVLTCARTGEWNSLENQIASVKRTLILRSFLKHPLNEITDWVRFLGDHFSEKVLHPTGFFICLIGPDGSGKTTISKGLKREMAVIFEKDVRYFHGHFNILPPLKTYYNILARIMGWPEKKVPDKDGSLGKKSIELSKFRALLYLAYYSIDYILGHFIVRLSMSRGEPLLFDRYFYDYFILRDHKKIPGWLLKPLGMLLPKPDLVIWLKNEPETLFQRKKDLSLEQIRDQIKKCMRIVNSIPSGISIETNDNIDKTVKRVVKAIILKMAGRI